MSMSVWDYLDDETKEKILSYMKGNNAWIDPIYEREKTMGARATKHLPPHQRLFTDMNIKHLLNLARDLTLNNHPPGNRIYEDYRDNVEGTSSVRYVAKFIRDNYSPEMIDKEHWNLYETYKRNQSGGAYRKGRPIGSRNSDDGSSVNVLDELDDDDNEPSTTEENKNLLANDRSNGAEPPVANNNQPNFDPSIFALKTELKSVATALENALKGYCETNFTNLQYENREHAKAILDLAERVSNIVDHRPTIIELKRPELPNLEFGIQHRNFELFVKAANARSRSGNHLNIWLYGPAGTGKTTAAEKLAELLELEYRYNGALTSAFQLTGYMDANGKYVSTAFRKAWEHGGVYLFDEIDGSMPDALLALNGALANSIASFPDGMIARHKDCVIIAGANTTGMGGGVEYVGAMKQNAAFLNRWVYIPWPHDDALEDALCANKEWLDRVRVVRAKWLTQGNKGHLITMRATIFGEALFAAGLTQEQVEHATLKQGLTDAQWNAIR